MDAADVLVPDETEPLRWAEICTRYPDQYVCLVDVVRPPLRSPEILTARTIRSARVIDHDRSVRALLDRNGIVTGATLIHTARRTLYGIARLVEDVTDSGSPTSPNRAQDSFVRPLRRGAGARNE